jgi:hypothetical protein
VLTKTTQRLLKKQGAWRWHTQQRLN